MAGHRDDPALKAARQGFGRPGRGWILPGLAMAAALSLLAAALRQVPEAVPLGRHHGMAMAMEQTGSSAAVQAGRTTTIVKPVSCRKLPDIPGKSLTTLLVDYPPNAYTPRHRHPGTVTAYVLKGTLRSQLAGGPAETYVAGQTWFEPPGAIHLFAENVSATEPAELLAILVTDDDCGPLVIPD